MRLLLTLAAAAALAACSHNNDNGVGQAPPETGRVAPADTSMKAAPPPTTGVDTTKAAPPPSTGFDTTKTTPPAAPAPVSPDTTMMRHDSM